jgi:hypothetical protein
MYGGKNITVRRLYYIYFVKVYTLLYMFTQGNEESVYEFSVAVLWLPVLWLFSVYVILLV